MGMREVWRGSKEAPPEPSSDVSGLRLIYLVTKGWEQYTEAWERMKANEKAINEELERMKANEKATDEELERMKAKEKAAADERRESRHRYDKWKRMLERVGRLSKDMTA